MKVMMAIPLAAILVMAVTITNISPADATKADTSNKLSPKSFGLKNAYKVSVEKTYDKEPFKKTSLKAEDLKTKLKLIEAKKAAELIKRI